MSLKQQVENLKTQIENKILNGEYEVIVANLSLKQNYIGELTIEVKGLEFHFAVNKEYKFICLLGSEIEIFKGFFEPGHFDIFRKHFEDGDVKEKRIKKLKDELKKLEK